MSEARCPVCGAGIVDGRFACQPPPTPGMGLTITREDKTMPMWQSDRRLWLNADKSQVVEDGDPDAAFLLVSAGGAIDSAEAERLGIRKRDLTVDATVAEDAETEPDADVKAQPRSANKARSLSETKAR